MKSDHLAFPVNDMSKLSSWPQRSVACLEDGVIKCQCVTIRVTSKVRQEDERSALYIARYMWCFLQRFLKHE